MKFITLDDLFDAMKRGKVHDWSNLNVFGGEDIEDTWNVWSWDAGRVIYGTCRQDLEILTRDELAELRRA